MASTANSVEQNNFENSTKNVRISIIPIEKLLGSVSYNDNEGAQPIRTSARVFKKMKTDLNTPIIPEKKEKKEEIIVKPAESRKINKILWTYEEKNLFFEALNEYGKDFESIHSYMMNRLRKKGVLQDEVIKTREQVRLLYIRQWHGIAKYLKFAEGVPRIAQELYGLINYGEVRKKVGTFSKPFRMKKLNELIQNGVICMRIKGKTVRVKTPMCKALRRLNQLDEKYDDLKLPSRVHVELKPKNMDSYLKVQSIAQNPRIKVAVSLQKRLASLITGINERWKTIEALIYEKASISTNVVTNDCVPDKKIIEKNSQVLSHLLRLTPPIDVQIDFPSFDISEYITRQSICLHAYELRKGVVKNKNAPDDIKKEEKETNEITNNKTDKTLQSNNIEDNIVDEKNILEKIAEDKVEIEKLNKIATIKKGWTLENCECLTIGELYLMFGHDTKLVLEYSWDNPEQFPKTEEAVVVGDKNLITNTLRKLLSLAKLHGNKEIIVNNKCNCETKNVQFKKPCQPKHETKPTTKVINSNIENENAMDTNIFDGELSNGSTASQQANTQMVNLVKQLNKLKPKFLNKKGRTLGGRQLVVERKLPLQPNKHDNKHQIVTMNIISQSQQNSIDSNDIIKDEPADTPNLFLSSSSTPAATTTIETKHINNNLDEKSADNFSGLLNEQTTSSALPMSISKILHEDNHHPWINSEVTDFSLSSFLGHLESTEKTTQSTVTIAANVEDTTHVTQSIDTQFHPILMETSMDFTEKFADFAAQVVNNGN